MITIALGSTVGDIVSGFRGVVTSRVEYINGCTQYGVQACVINDMGEPDSKMPKVVYIDEAQLKVKTDVEVIKPILTFGEQKVDKDPDPSVHHHHHHHSAPAGPQRGAPSR